MKTSNRFEYRSRTSYFFTTNRSLLDKLAEEIDAEVLESTTAHPSGEKAVALMQRGSLDLEDSFSSYCADAFDSGSSVQPIEGLCVDDSLLTFLSRILDSRTVIVYRSVWFDDCLLVNGVAHAIDHRGRTWSVRLGDLSIDLDGMELSSSY
jgi:hypothetical protein